MIPPQDSNRQDRQASPPNPPGSGTGWQSQRELGPQPGIDLIDRMVVNAEAQERQQRAPRDSMIMEIVVHVLKLQSDDIKSLTQRINALEQQQAKAQRAEARPKAGSKKP